MKKVLISPGYGAGWSTWYGGNDEARKAMLQWPPLVEAAERGDTIDEKHPAVQSMVEHFTEKGWQIPYMGSCLAQLSVVEVNGPFCIEEYDGWESLRTTYDFETLD